jgi:HNH endonuclease
MSKQIQLSQGVFTVIDDEDFEYLNQWKWRINNYGYAVRNQNIKSPSGKKTSRIIRMHRVILNPDSNLQVDHINNDKLDNRKINLRQCTNQENGRNRPKPITNTSGFKGIEWLERNKKWRARIGVNKVLIHIGLFSCKIEAAKAYNNAALKYHGQFANLNEIPAQ